MSSKDIRDIAAYWGAVGQWRIPRSISKFLHFPNGNWVREHHDEKGRYVDVTIDAEALTLLLANDFLVPMLYLRPLSSLTDGEVRELACISNYSSANFDPSTAPIRRFNDCIELGTVDDLTIAFADVSVYANWMRLEYRMVLTPGKAIGYLQSIGVYVPGTIDEQYVQLIE